MNLSATVKTLSSLMLSLQRPTDPDDRLSVRGEALVRLWAEPFMAFVQNMGRHQRKHYDASRVSFERELKELQRTIKATVSERRVAAPKRLQQVAQELVMLHAVIL